MSTFSGLSEASHQRQNHIENEDMYLPSNLQVLPPNRIFQSFQAELWRSFSLEPVFGATADDRKTSFDANGILEIQTEATDSARVHTDT